MPDSRSDSEQPEYGALAALDDRQWESLCDGCGRCCMVKLEDEESGELHFTNIACRLFDISRCCCRDYEYRSHRVEGCLVLRPLTTGKLAMLPDSCAYKRLAGGKELESWHHLVSGSSETVHTAGISMRDKAFPEEAIHPKQYEEHIIDV